LERSRFAALLRQHRLECGLSQEELAEAAAISRSAVGAYERGIHSAPHRETIKLLAEALHLTGTVRAEFESAARRKPHSPSGNDDRSPGNLPFPSTSFVGRERELAQLRNLLGQHRIVTLTGSGGVGKTRLAIRAAAEGTSSYENGAWFVDLGRIRDETLVVSQVASTLGIQAQGAGATTEALAGRLQRQTLLLVLDNCEHILPAVGALAATIVRICPRITILATSRERLRITGEAVIRVPTLTLPERTIVGLTDAQAQPAIVLFADRAEAVNIDFALTAANLGVVVEICRRLDGIPLAIELAAARLAAFSLGELLEKLAERFELLSVGPRDLAPRQQTLMATIDWSYDLLDENERALLRALSLFAATFSKEAARVVFEKMAPDQSADALLSSLVEKSLVTKEAIGDNTRYAMLETMREYARAKSNPEELAIAMRGYAEWAASVADDYERTHYAMSWATWLRRVAQDFDNLSVALAWALNSRRDVVIAARIIAGLRSYWVSAGRVQELGRYATDLLELLSPESHPWIVARLNLCRVNSVDLKERIRAINAARELFESIHDSQGLAICELHLATACRWTDNGAAVAMEHADAALKFATEAELSRLLPHIALLRSHICDSQGRLEESRDLAKQALEVFTEFDEGMLALSAASTLFVAEFSLGRLDSAAVLAEDIERRMSGLAQFENSTIVAVRLALAQYRVAIGEIEWARRAARSVLQDAQAQWASYIDRAIDCIAAATAASEPIRAARLYGFTSARENVERNPSPFARLTVKPVIESELGKQLRPEALSRHLADGAQLDLNDAIAEALAVR